jgi:glycosyltransferase involved in cell wall biosynthesis
MHDNQPQLPEAESVPSPLAGARVILVIGDLEMGGTERQVLLLAQYLKHAAGAHVEIWGLGRKLGPVAEKCDQIGIEWHMSPVDWFVPKSRKLVRMSLLTWKLRRSRPDAILSYLILPNVVSALIWPWTGARICIWNQRCTGTGRVGPETEQMAVARVSGFATNSEGGARFLRDALAVPAERIRVIRNAISLKKPAANRAAWRSRLGVSEDTLVASMIANLTIYKDHETLLQSWKQVIDSLQDAGLDGVLVLAGRLDSKAEMLKVMAFDLELRDRVRFLGHVDDVSGLLNASDLGVFSSSSESGPNGVLEAMAAGLALAASDNSGVREAVAPDGHDLLAPPGDAQALASQILRLARDRSLRERLGRANRLRIEAEYDPGRMCRRTVAMIVESLERAKSASAAADQTATAAVHHASKKQPEGGVSH